MGLWIFHKYIDFRLKNSKITKKVWGIVFCIVILQQRFMTKDFLAGYEDGYDEDQYVEGYEEGYDSHQCFSGEWQMRLVAIISGNFRGI